MHNNDLVPGFDDERDEKLSITLDRIACMEGGLIVHLVGYVDTYNSVVIQKRIQKALDSGYMRLVFDLHALAYVSSTGINSFISFLKAAQQRGGDIVLVGMQDVVASVFEILGFTSFFTLRDSVEEAKEYFLSGRVAAAS
jgi:anti-anti-sigma factor